MTDRLNKKYLSILNRTTCIAAAIALIGGSIVPAVYAGAFIFAAGNGADIIAHPTGYTGAGGILPVNVCIVPSSPFATDMEVPVQNTINTLNKSVPTIGNFNFTSGLLGNEFDFESVALHEVGHCVGLAHPNLGSQTGLAAAETNFTNATPGTDNQFGLGAGADGVIGSSDDVRGDDENLHWFDMATNDPFAIQALVDATTFSRSLTDLPSGDLFATSADRDVGVLLGYANTEAVMQQGSFGGEAQRTLAADDVHTLQLGRTGLDMIAGTADDYTIDLRYQGITSTNCDINIAFDATQTGFAVCQTNGSFINSTHIAITSANIFLNENFNWIFNQTSNMPAATCNGLPIDVDIGAGDVPTSGDDVILGTPGNDVISGKGGNDTICGMGGNDFINGNGGDDWIHGGEGVDDLRGGGGDDIIFTGPGATVGTASSAEGGTGDDEIHGGEDADVLLGGVNRDTIYGGDGDDVIRGNGSFDTISGEGGDDDIRGNAGNDVLFGGPGNDVVNGGSGNGDFCDGGGQSGDTQTQCE